MPYLAHFGLKDHPFTLTPNVDYYYPTQENANIIASLDFALRRDSGIIKIVGEVGTGKTLLCRLLINKLVDTDAVAYINAPQADAGSIVRAICDEFGIEAPGPEASPYPALNRFLVDEHAKGRLAVVVVDEAQHLGKDGLEAMRLVSNLETEKSKLLQIVLFGQTELDDLLRDPSLRQLNQRVVFSFNTKPLTLGEAKRYVGHRIRVSRRQGVEYDAFSDAALTAIARASGGIPRVINILADKSLLVAFSDGSPTVQRGHAVEAIKDTPGLVVRRGFWWTFPRLGWKTAAAAATLALVMAAAAGWSLWRSGHHGREMAVTETVAPPANTAAPSLAAAAPAAPAVAPPAPAAAAAQAPNGAAEAAPVLASSPALSPVAIAAPPATATVPIAPTPVAAPPEPAPVAASPAPAPVATLLAPAPSPPASTPPAAKAVPSERTSERPPVHKTAEHKRPAEDHIAAPSQPPAASGGSSPVADAAPAAPAPAVPAVQMQAATQPLAPTQSLAPPPPEAAPLDSVTMVPAHPGVYPGAKSR